MIRNENKQTKDKTMNLPEPKRTGKKIKVEHTAFGYSKTEWFHLCMIEGTNFLWVDGEGSWLNNPSPDPEVATNELFNTYKGTKVVDTRA
jgi:hypothetical protein